MELSLNKTERSDTFIYSEDASKLFSLSSGGVLIQLELPFSITNGVYELCDEDKFFTDYLLFAVNQGNLYFAQPGIYAAFTPEGIKLSIWRSTGLFTVTDVTTSIPANTPFVIEFFWDAEGALGQGCSMAISVNEDATAGANPPLKFGSIEGKNFYGIDSASLDFNLRSKLSDFLVYSEAPEHAKGIVKTRTSTYLDAGYVLLCGKNGSLLYNGDISKSSITIPEIVCFGDSRYSVDACDTSSNIYFCNFFDDGFRSGSVSLYSAAEGKVTKSLDCLENPKAVSVIQKDAIDFPRFFYNENAECDGTWIADKSEVILTDNQLNVTARISGFSDPCCIKQLNDGNAWVSDTGNDRVALVSSDASEIVATVSVNGPTFLATTNDSDAYVYSSDGDVVLIRDNAIESSTSVGLNIVALEVNPNSGDVLVVNDNGKIFKYNRNMEPKGQFNIDKRAESAIIAKGHNRDAFYIVNRDFDLIEKRQSSKPSEILNSGTVGDFLFSLGMAAVALNEASLVTIDADFEIDFFVDNSAIDSSISIAKADTIDVDLSGGGENEAFNRRNDIKTDDKPTDLQKKIIKTSRV
jgi:hypothetical protein